MIRIRYIYLLILVLFIFWFFYQKLFCLWVINCSIKRFFKNFVLLAKFCEYFGRWKRLGLIFLQSTFLSFWCQFIISLFLSLWYLVARFVFIFKSLLYNLFLFHSKHLIFIKRWKVFFSIFRLCFKTWFLILALN